MEWKSISWLFFSEIKWLLWFDTVCEICASFPKKSQKKKFDPLLNNSFRIFVLSSFFFLEGLFYSWWKTVKMGLCNIELHGFYILSLFFLVLYYYYDGVFEWRFFFVWNACCHRWNSNAWIEEECNGYAANQFLTIKMSMGFQQYLTTFLLWDLCVFRRCVCAQKCAIFRIANSFEARL